MSTVFNPRPLLQYNNYVSLVEICLASQWLASVSSGIEKFTLSDGNGIHDVLRGVTASGERGVT